MANYYNAIETTPLRFHKFIWFVWMPFSLLVAVLNAWEAIVGFLGFLPTTDSVALTAIVVGCLLEMAFVVAPVLIFIGFFRWKKFSWYILLFLSVSNIVCSPFFLPDTIKTEGVASATGSIFGVILDIITVVYYWKRQRLFGIDVPAFTKKLYCLNADANDQKYCRFCGCKLPPKSVFCNFCGKKL